MRPLILLCAIVALASLAMFALMDRGEPHAPEPNMGDMPDRILHPESAPEPSPELAAPLPELDDEARTDDTPVVPEMMAGAIPSGPLRSFHGAALLQRKGERIRQTDGGTIDLDLIYKGARKRITTNIVQGHFAVDVPTAARVLMIGGRFDGEDVHFDDPKGTFYPTDDDYALIGVVSPSMRISVRDGGQGSAITGVMIRRAEGATSSTIGDAGPAGELIVEGATSPIRLPFIDAKRPVWLSISAQGYAATNILIDPRKTGEKSVRLWASADLTVKVTGKGRGRLRMLILTRDEGGGVKPHAGAFGITNPAMETTPNALLFPLKGLAAIPHTIRAKGYDPRGVTVDLGELLHVDLGPSDGRTIELRID